ncbi:hypothetical protein TH5_00775 [Thalassospira xianhensis MCCC 1A02616]|uniref:Uncharacterized protein n=2 Tax=Thalassospira xianhensis TaxID=478503 RepID=A0A367UKJ4_9PROT|nr:hypothetical protein TH5_00775 [Thalassospira xianhensis MCCC 1A02616]
MRNKIPFYIVLFGVVILALLPGVSLVSADRTSSSWTAEVVTPLEAPLRGNQELTVVLDYYRRCAGYYVNPAITNDCLTETAEFVERLQLPASAFGLMRQLAINNTAFWNSDRD